MFCTIFAAKISSGKNQIVKKYSVFDFFHRNFTLFTLRKLVLIIRKKGENGEKRGVKTRKSAQNRKKN